MACGCERRISPKKYTNCTANPKHEVQDVTFWDCTDRGGLSCTGYKDVHLGATTVRTPGNTYPKC